VSQFLVSPGGPLRGTVAISGAKNSVLKIMAAAILAEGTTVLRNVPEIRDVEIMAEMLAALGLSVTRLEDQSLEIVTPATPELVPEAPYELVEKMRASIVVLGPLLARCGRAKVSMPGGDDFGSRPIDFHLNALEQMGTTFAIAHGIIDGHVANGRLAGASMVLPFPSHTTTDNLLMAAVLAEGTTVIENAAQEPEVVDLAEFLIAMGAKITGAGTSRITVTGVSSLGAVTHEIIPDRVVAATFFVAAAIAGGTVNVRGARIDHMESLVRKLEHMGISLSATPDGVRVDASSRLKATDLATLPYPGVATDYTPFLVAALATAEGVSFVTENLFAGRFRYVDELLRMGADIRTDGHHLVIRGVRQLSGARVKSHDIRAGAAVMLAGLTADGDTTIDDAGHLDRGYENLPHQLSTLGASVVRLS
jgi:UDP-N-acetylglucosamine 1-carboxyvinyltransferase